MNSFAAAVATALALGGLPASAAAAPQAAEPRNLQVLTGVPLDQVRQFMQAVSASLGVECEHCHVDGSFELDTIPAKGTARAMMRMAAALGETTFELLDAPSCWTCHRGSPAPEAVPPPLLIPLDPPPAPFSESASPAEDVYANIQVHRGLPASELRGVMGGYGRALGVGCDHCHQPGDWAGDANVLKPLTRAMVEMQRAVTRELGFEEGRITCWTCHRGDVTPETQLPAGVLTDDPTPFGAQP